MSDYDSVDTMKTDVESLEKQALPEEWKPQKKEWFMMISLSIISLMVALDATILVTVLPVSFNLPNRQYHATQMLTAY